jgi:3',5'-cyclic AMP phosphodiesterase CpdA
MAAGDLVCAPGSEVTDGVCRHEAVSDLVVDADPAAFLALGDLCYDAASEACFAQAYDPSFGRVKARTLPALGNHEYREDPAAYFDYFGRLAGDPGRGYYSRDVGDWHVVVLNSTCDAVGGCAPGDPQGRWLRADLAANDARCTLAMWHHPLYSSGDHGSQPNMRAMWEVLMEHDAELVLSGHDHHYERFEPLDAGGELDPAGLRSFVVGSGGKSHYRLEEPLPGSASRNDDTYGVLELTLRPAGYDWRFVPVAGGTFADSGSGDCR